MLVDLVFCVGKIMVGENIITDWPKRKVKDADPKKGRCLRKKKNVAEPHYTRKHFACRYVI